MADMPVTAPKFDPMSMIRGIAEKVQANELQLAIFVGICALIVGYILYLIIEEYKKSPLKFKRQKMGKNGFKLSDMLRKK